MAPNPVFGRYKLYKSGTQKLVQWLATTASRCCDVTSIVHSLRSDSQTHSANAKAAAVKVTTQELLRLAQAIASTHVSIDIPDNILTVTDDVIAAREVSAAWYGEQDISKNSELAQDNDTHRYFILVLKRIYELLSKTRQHSVEPPKNEGNPKPLRSKRATSHASDDTNDQLNNLFACLEVEEPSASPLGVTTPKPSPSAVPASRLEHQQLQLQDSDSDPAFALWCFLLDLQDVRKFVRETWVEYTKGAVSMLVAGVLTDTAFGIMRRANEDFVSVYPNLTDYASVLEHLEVSAMGKGGRTTLWTGISGKNEEKTPLGENPADLICHSGFITLSRFYNRLAQTAKQISSQEDSDESGRDWFLSLFSDHPFAHALMDMVPHLAVYGRHGNSLGRGERDTVGDEYFFGLMTTLNVNAILMWLVVATKTYMDIYDLIGSIPSSGADYLKRSLKGIAKIAETHKVLRLTLDRDPEYNAEMPKSTLGNIVAVEDNYQALRNSLRRNSRRHDSRDSLELVRDIATVMQHCMTVDADRLKELHAQAAVSPGMLLFFETVDKLPVLACRYAVIYKNDMYEASLEKASDSLVLLAAAHLYKAARTYGLLTSAWEDMGFALALHDSKQPLVTKVSNNADPYALARYYRIALGMPASAFARDARPRLPSKQAVTKNARTFKITSTFLRAMRDHKEQEAGRGALRVEILDQILDCLTEQDETSSSTDSTDTSSSNTKRKTHKQKSFTPNQLLATFKKNLIAHEPQFHFDYLGLIHMCTEIIAWAVWSLRSEGLSNKINGTEPGYGVVDFLLWDAADAVKASKPISQTWLAKVAALMQDAISREGKRFTKMAFDESSGRIPKDKRPVFVTPKQKPEATDGIGKREVAVWWTSPVTARGNRSWSKKALETGWVEGRNKES